MNKFKNYIEPETFIDERGYQRFTSSGKLVHRIIAAIKIGRSLKPQEVVHHRNRKKLDNRPENLQVFANRYIHAWVHQKEAIKYGEKWSYYGSASQVSVGRVEDFLMGFEHCLWPCAQQTGRYTSRYGRPEELKTLLGSQSNLI